MWGTAVLAQRVALILVLARVCARSPLNPETRSGAWSGLRGFRQSKSSFTPSLLIVENHVNAELLFVYRDDPVMFLLLSGGTGGLRQQTPVPPSPEAASPRSGCGRGGLPRGLSWPCRRHLYPVSSRALPLSVCVLIAYPRKNTRQHWIRAHPQGLVLVTSLKTVSWTSLMASGSESSAGDVGSVFGPGRFHLSGRN